MSGKINAIHPLGARLSDGLAHHRQHSLWSRRNFLSTMGISSGMSMVLGSMPVKGAAMTSLGAGLLNADSDRVLVLVQLNGGNDGLNTTIPLYDYDFYRNQRPRIGLAQGSVINLSDEIGIQSSMQDLLSLWEDGAMKIIHNVGYPNPNLSHFRGSDIWSAASDDAELLKSGWLGRWLNDEYPEYANEPPKIPPAIQIGSYGSLIFNNGMFNLSVSVTNPAELAEIAQNGELYDTKSLPETCYGEELSFVRSVSNSTFSFAETIKEAFDASTTQANYENILNNLGDQLELVARLIKGNLGSKIYMVSISGFDTHADQNQTHPLIWQGIAQAIKSFYDDLAAGEKANDVLTMTFSEFGRRIEENASMGTDHGTAAPMFLFGPGLTGNGFVGTQSNLRDPDEFGNLKFSTDFREAYATILEHWLCVDAAVVDQALGASYPRIDGLVTECGLATSVYDPLAQTNDIFHKALYNGNGDILIQFQLPRSAQIQVEIYSIQGSHVASLLDDVRGGGQHSVLFSPHRYNLASGHYMYSIRVNGQPHSAALQVIK